MMVCNDEWFAFMLVCINDWFEKIRKYQNILSIIFLNFQNSENLIKPVVFQLFNENVNISLVLPLPVGDLSRI